MEQTSLAPHVTTIVALLGVIFSLLIGAVGFIALRIWFNIDKLAGRIDEFFRLHYECQARLPEKFVTKENFESFHKEWREFLTERKRDWDKLWDVFNNHRHQDKNGAVVRREII